MTEKLWPKISIITPSYNQAHFLEETILSVLDQHYPNLEYIIIDGGSTDNSREVIEKYEGHLAYWVSEKDQGQTDAIIKGMKRSTGDILGWLNSDDTYLPGCLKTVGEAFLEEADADVIYGDYVITDVDGRRLLSKKEIKFDFDILLYAVNFIGQPAAFFTRSAYEELGGLDANLNYFMDLEFFLRMGKNKRKFTHLKRYLATYRFHGESKTITEHRISERCIKEFEDVLNKYWDRRRFKNPQMHKLYHNFLRTIFRLKRQILKIFYQHTFDFIPGKIFVWYYKNVKLPKGRRKNKIPQNME